MDGLIKKEYIWNMD